MKLVVCVLVLLASVAALSVCNAAKVSSSHRLSVDKKLCVANVPNVMGVLKGGSTCCGGLKCPFENGVCCEGGSHCCGYGTVCVQGDAGTPPGCLHVMDEVNRVFSGAPKKPKAKWMNVRRGADSLARVPAPAAADFPKFQEVPQVTPTIIRNPATTTTTTPCATQSKCAPPCPCAKPKPACPCNACPCPDIKVRRVVYEDALAPQDRNAFAQYRIQKTNQGAAHPNQLKGDIVTGRLATETAGKPMPGLKVSDVSSQKQAAAAGATTPGSPAVNKKLETNVAGSFNVKQRTGHMNEGVYNLPDESGKIVPYKVVIKQAPRAENGKTVPIRQDDVTSKIQKASNYLPSFPRFIEEKEEVQREQQWVQPNYHY